MIRVFILIGLLSSLYSQKVEIDSVKYRNFDTYIMVNSQIVQFSNAKTSVSSQISGKVVNYYVHIGQEVKKGDKIAKIESLKLSNISSELISAKNRLNSIEKNYQITKKLYKAGVESFEKLNRLTTQRDSLKSKIAGLKSTLSLLGIKADKRVTAFTLYAQNSGRVSKILIPLNGRVGSQSTLLSITRAKDIMVKSYIPTKYFGDISVGNRVSIKIGDTLFDGKITQILPQVDEVTQQIIILSDITNYSSELFINSFVQSKIYLNRHEGYLSVKKSALSFFQNEWVVFVPNKKKYEINIVKIIKESDEFVAVEGIKENQKYVSKNSYYIKSLMLKSQIEEE